MLRNNRGRAKWGTYPCTVCGRVVGVEETGGRWIPERHWATMVYRSRKAQGTRHADLPDTGT
jgi:hypothetical protein